MRRLSTGVGLATLLAASLSLGTIQGAFAGGQGGPPTPTCQVNPGSFGPDLGTSVNLGFEADQPASVNAVSANQTLAGFPTWDFLLSNSSAGPVTNPHITVNSGYDPSVFQGSLPTPAFPTSCGVPAMNPNSILFFPTIRAPGIATNSTVGFDASRSVSPTVIPAGGGRQTVTVAVDLNDPRYAVGPSSGNNFLVNIETGFGDSVVSTASPTNLDQGEFLNHDPAQSSWFMNQAVLGKVYVFSAVIDYANDFAEPWTHVPGVDVTAATFNGCAICGNVFTSPTLPVPSLDGGTSGGGSVTFAVDDPGHSWSGGYSYIYNVRFQNLFSDVTASEGFDENFDQPTSVDATSAGTVLTGWRSWDFQVKSGQLLTNATVAVTTGYPANVLSAYAPQPGVVATTNPVLFTQASGKGFEVGLNARSVPVDFQPGYDSTRTVTPLVVPVGVGQQTVKATVTPIDPGVSEFNVIFFDSLPGMWVVSSAGPDNLGQGEWLAPGGPGFASWSLGNVVTGKTYSFTATIGVRNPFGVPFVHKPSIHLFGHHRQPGGCVACVGPSSSVSMTDSTLVNQTQGSGTVTFSVGSSGHYWHVIRDERRVIRYEPTQWSQLKKLGPATVATENETVRAFLAGGGGPISGATVVFSAGSSSCTATSANGAAGCTLSPALPPGSYSLTASFAGNETSYPSSASAPLLVYQPTQFVIWGGNLGGVSAGGDYTFWSSTWANQVTGGAFQANPSFKGYADTVSDGAWSAAPGASSGPPDSVGDYISVVVATSASRHGDSTTGTVGKVVILRVDDPSAYAPDAGHTGSGVLVGSPG